MYNHGLFLFLLQYCYFWMETSLRSGHVIWFEPPAPIPSNSLDFHQVSSRITFQIAAVLLLMCGLFGKFGGALVMCPDPVIGALSIMGFAMVISVGLSTFHKEQSNPWTVSDARPHLSILYS